MDCSDDTHFSGYPVESAGFETNLAHRSGSWVAEKRRIAAAAVDQLGDAETVFLDGKGSTPQLVAEQLAASERQLTVVTSSLASAGVLAAAPSPDGDHPRRPGAWPDDGHRRPPRQPGC